LQSESDPRWVVQKDVYVRYPKLEGNELQVKIFSDYVVPGELDVRLSLFDEQGVPCLKRHKLNDRDHSAVREVLVKDVLKKGLIEGVRGEAWAICTQVAGYYELISHATLAEALYIAHGRDPDNRFARQPIQVGIAAKVFDARTPPDVIRYLKELHNEFHGGAGASHLDKYDHIDTIVAAFAAHRREHQINPRSLPTKGEGTYEKVYKKFLEENYARTFSNFFSFCNAWKFCNGMDNIAIKRMHCATSRATPLIVTASSR
jgi:hypothetical protein